MKMNKGLLILLLPFCFSGCLTEEANVYSVKGFIGNNPDVLNFEIENSTIGLYEGDRLIATSEIKNGIFSFENLKENKTYTVIPPLLKDSRNGLSSLDIVKVENYIAGTNELNIYEKLAADVNKDGLINQIDLDQMRSCIIQSVDCHGWRYYTSDYDGKGHGSLDQMTFPHIFADHNVTFRMVKLGDINCTICPG
ncbi:MAG: dockerin type I domain-containing protein [Saprospiraceae bacterium]